MILVFGANCEKFEDLGLKPNKSSPFFEIKPPGITDGKKILENCTAYIELLGTTAKDKLPEIAEEAQNLSEKGQTVVDGAQSEIEALGGLDKAKAGVAAAKNVKALSSLPTSIKTFAEKLKAELEGLKALVEELNDTNAIKALVETAKAKSPKTGRDAYRCVYGGVYYTDIEMKAWRSGLDKNITVKEEDY
jgi:hypothetical protein